MPRKGAQKPKTDVWGILLVGVALAARLVFAWGSLKNPVFAQHDDAFYYYKIAWNIVHGNGICFTPGIPTNGFHPLWLLMLLPIYAIVPKNELNLPIHIASTITAVAITIAIYIIYRLLRERYPKAPAWLVALILGVFAINPNILYHQMCGMETGFSLLPFAVAIYTHHKLIQGGENYGKNFRWWVAANIVLLWLRIDFAIIVWLLNIHLLWRWRSKRLIPYLVLINASVLPWVLWCKLRFGHWVPISGLAFNYARNNFFFWKYGKSISTYLHMWKRELKLALFPALFRSFGGIIGLLGMIVLCVLWLKRSLKRLSFDDILNFYLLPFIVGIIVYGIILHWLVRLLVRDYYYVPVHIVTILVIAETLLTLKERKKKIIAGCVIVVMLIASIHLFATHTIRDCSIRHRDVTVINKLPHLPTNSIIGAFNAGRLGYYVHFVVINLDGAVNPQAFKAITEHRLWSYIINQGITILADSPYPIWERFRPFMGSKDYLTKLLPISYFQDIGTYFNDLGLFRIVSDIKQEQLDSLLSTPLAKTRAIYYLARALQEVGDIEKAMKLLLSTRSMSAHDVFSRQGYEWALRERGKWLEAERLWETGDTLAARRAFEKALAETPSLKDRYALLNAFYGTIGKLDSAFVWGRMGLFFTPQNPLIPYNMGVFFARSGKPDSAEVYFRRTLGIAPSYAPALTNLGVLLLNAGECDSAITYFRLAFESNKSWTYLQNLIGGLQACGKNKELVKWIDYATEHFPDEADAHHLHQVKRQALREM